MPQEGRNPRRLTPRECARLMGFDDSFEIPVSDTQAYRQFGNSVVVPLMAEVARRVAAPLLAAAGKYLFSLQQGVSANQLREMADERVRLVSPKGNLGYFAAEVRPTVWTLADFTRLVPSKQDQFHAIDVDAHQSSPAM